MEREGEFKDLAMRSQGERKRVAKPSASIKHLLMRGKAGDKKKEVALVYWC